MIYVFVKMKKSAKRGGFLNDNQIHFGKSKNKKGNGRIKTIFL